MSKCKEFRRRARETLDHGIFKGKWMYALLAVLIVSAIEACISMTIIGIIVTIVIMGPLTYGLCKTWVTAIRNNNERVDLGNLFKGFSENFGRTFVANLLTWIFTFLWSLLLIIPGIIKTYAYSMTNYILVDDPNIEANAAITKSRKMMKGHKGKLFLLDLSFIGWYLLGLLCLGIGVFWVAPYHEVAKAHFYEELKAESEKVVEAK